MKLLVNILIKYLSERFFLPYEELKDHRDMTIDYLFRRLIKPDATFRNKIHG